MAYAPYYGAPGSGTGWENGKGAHTPMAAEAFDTMEQGLIDAHTGLDEIAPGVNGSRVIATGKLPDLGTTYGKIAASNTWTGPINQFTALGNCIDLTGGVVAGGAAGAFYRASMGIQLYTGTNGSRGDSIASDAANGTDASYFYGWSVIAQPFDTKGSFSGYAFYATLAANAAYGEIGGYQSSITCSRAGGLVEGYEAQITDTSGQQGRVSGYTSVISEANATITYWCRGYWAVSIGAQPAGDAYYADGAGGWINFARFKDTAGAERFRIDNTGKLFIGSGARTLYDNGSALVTDAMLAATGGLYTSSSAQAASYGRVTDSARFITWGTGAPTLAASVGSLYLRLDGGANTTLYVKESGTGTTGWVGK